MQAVRTTLKRITYYVLLAGLAVWGAGCGDAGLSNLPETWAVKRKDLNIVVEKGGSIEAAVNTEVRCEVMGQSRIIYLIPEGRRVEKGEVLVKLDSSDLEDQLTKQEISYQSALASKIQAEEQFEIQKSQNESDISQTKLNLYFALLDFKKYTGYSGSLPRYEQAIGDLSSDEPQVVDRHINSTILESTPEVVETSDGGGHSKENGTNGDAPSAPLNVQEAESIEEGVDLNQFLVKPLDEYELGEAAQLWRDRESALQLAKSKYEISRYNKEGSEKLYKKNFLSKTKLDADLLDFQNAEIQLKKAEEDLRLLRMFTHEKNVNQYISDLRESYKELYRVKRKAKAQLSLAAADLNAKKSKFEREEELKEKYEKQVENCIIKAPSPGLVVYARPQRRWRSEEFIEEGTMVHERQQLINLPDLNNLIVEVKIHESKIALVKEGQRAEIIITSLDELTLEGSVQRVGILPDHVDRFLNPDLKVYNVKIAIEDSTGFELKPGMSANVKILVDRVENVLCVPVQSIVAQRQRRYVQVLDGGSLQRHEVSVGRYNDRLAVIEQGLEEGDHVMLTPILEDSRRDEKKEAETDRSGERSAFQGPAPKSDQEGQETGRDSPAKTPPTGARDGRSRMRPGSVESSGGASSGARRSQQESGQRSRRSGRGSRTQ